MPQSEFDIIEDYFIRQRIKRDDVKLGIGDDAALISIPKDQQLVVSMDTLVSNVHFPTNTSAEDIGYKSLAVNLSDLAAMGAVPAWFTLALTLPNVDNEWLQGFAKGLFILANKYNLQLVGGDTTQGPLTVSIQIAGYVPAGKALMRRGAKVGDSIYVTGTLGDAALGLRCLQQPDEYKPDPEAINKLNHPSPRVDIGLAIRDIASACIDISDGLLADLGHILDANQVGASLDRKMLPLSHSMKLLCDEHECNYDMVLAGGDDYELCFCVSPQNEPGLESIVADSGVRLTRIGQIEQQTGMRLYNGGQLCDLKYKQGFEHFTG